MQRILSTFAGLTLAAAAIAAPAGAQNVADTRAVRFGVQAGIGIPMGDFGDVSGNGVLVAGTLDWRGVNWPVGLRLDVGYQRYSGAEVTVDFGDEVITADVTPSIIYGTGSAVLTVPTAGGVRPYLIGGVGFYHMTLDVEAAGESDSESEDKFGLHGGAGLNFSLGSLDTYLEARYHTVFTSESNTNFLPIVVGIRF